MARLALLTLCLAVLTASCAPKILNLRDYDEGAIMPEQARRDAGACRMEASRTSENNYRFNNIYDGCMVSKGYKRIKK